MIFKKSSHQSGFSLLELLLSTFILSGLLLIVFGVMENYAQRVKAKSQAAYIDKIALSVKEILKNPNYYQAIYDEIAIRTPALIELTADDLLNGFMVGSVLIPPSNVLNANIQNNSEIIIARADSGLKDTLSVLVANTALVDVTNAKRISTFLKENGAIYDGTTSNIVNAFHSWNIPLSSINNTNIGTTINSSPPTDDDVYYFHYSHVPFEYITGDYLYRTAVVGRPELNRMYGVLNMGNNSILGADDISTIGDVTLTSGAILNKSLTVNDNSDIQSGDLIVNDVLNTSNATIRGVALSGQRGNLIVDGTININNTATVLTELNADNAVLKGGVTTTGTMNIENLNTDGSINTNNAFITTVKAGNGNTQDINVTNQIAVNTMTTDTINLQQGNIGVIDGIVNNGITLGGSISANRVEIDNLNTDTFGACDKGC